MVASLWGWGSLYNPNIARSCPEVLGLETQTAVCGPGISDAYNLLIFSTHATF